MRRLVAIAAIGIVLGSGAIAAPRSDGAAKQAASVVESFHSALAKGDTKAAAALLADDALIFEQGGAERSKAEYAAHHLPADAEFSKTVASKTMRRSAHAADGIAWVATEGRTTGTYKGKALDQLTTETMVLRRSGSDWKIVHIHWSSAKR
jgi:ketosteroid isomerase-like protein